VLRLWDHAYRDKKVVGVFVRFRAPLQPFRLNLESSTLCIYINKNIQAIQVS
jgi:hypothetical protein